MSATVRLFHWRLYRHFGCLACNLCMDTIYTYFQVRGALVTALSSKEVTSPEDQKALAEAMKVVVPADPDVAISEESLVCYILPRLRVQELKCCSFDTSYRTRNLD